MSILLCGSLGGLSGSLDRPSWPSHLFCFVGVYTAPPKVWSVKLIRVCEKKVVRLGTSNSLESLSGYVGVVV